VRRLHDDDAQREFAYDRDFRPSAPAGAVDDAESCGLVLVSMWRDWKSVFVEIA